MSHYSRLYSSLLKSQWAISPQFAQQWFPRLNDFIDHHQPMAFDDDEGQKKQPGMVYNFLTEDGQPIPYSQSEELPENSVAIIDLIGPMIKWGNYYCWGADELSMMITDALGNEKISGLILRIDSGGGAVDAIPPFAQVLQERDKPVIALCDMAASAAYYTAIYCDEIWGDNNISAEFGSIGVMVSFYDNQKAMEERGYKRHVIYAPESTYKNQPFELALEGKYELIKSEVLSPLAQKFQQDVRDQRPGLNLDTEGVLNGRMFYAETAREIGLIDNIGGLPQAVQRLKQLSAGRSLRSVNLNAV